MAKRIKKEKRVDFCESCKYIGNLYNLTHDTHEPFMGVCKLDGFSKIIDRHYCHRYLQRIKEDNEYKN